MHSPSRRHQCLLQPQLNSFFYLWLLIEAGQIPPQNLLHSTVWIIFKDSPAGQNIKYSLYCSHTTFISQRCNNINSSSISSVLKGSKFCAAARKGICQLKKQHTLLCALAKSLTKFLKCIRFDGTLIYVNVELLLTLAFSYSQQYIVSHKNNTMPPKLKTILFFFFFVSLFLRRSLKLTCLLHGLFQYFEISYNNLGWKGLLKVISSNPSLLKDNVGSKHKQPFHQ